MIIIILRRNFMTNKTNVRRRRRRRRNSSMPTLIAILVISIVCLVGLSISLSACSKGKEASSDNVSIEETESTTVEETTTTPPDVTVDIMMIGDILAHEGVYNSGLQADGTYNFDHLFKNIKSDISAADIRIVNQETILGGVELGLSGYPCFNSPYEIGVAEAKAGFNVILHATNHTLDKGLTGVENCLNFWKTNYPEMAVLGINETEEDYNDIYVYNKDGFKIAILNYTYGTNGIAIPASKPYIVNMLDVDKITQDVTKAKEIADMVVVCPHWGTEYVYEPDSNQKYWTNLFLKLGVDVVIGAHPHVMEPVETLTRDDGHQMVVYYSLGNFVSNQDKMPRMLGGMAKVTLVKSGTDNSCYIKQYSYTPIVTQKLFGTSLITSYKLSDYNDTLASENAIRKDSGNSEFSLSYCQELCKLVFGDSYDESSKMVYVKLRD
jgi:poly-gamma-glutamate capsule biosynthesis protein CapA/YwtB (metallophosphatase superfamily)